MALLVGELYALLLLEKKAFTAGLAEARTEAAVAGRSIQASLVAAGRIIATGLAIAAGSAALIGIVSIKAAEEFQASMTQIQTQAGGSAEEVKNLSKAVLDMAGDVGTAPEDLAKGLYHIESAGIRGAEAIDVIRAAALGAKVGMTDLEGVTNALVAEVRSGIGGVKDMDSAMGILNATVGAGNMRMADLTAAFGTGILSVAKTFGVSIQGVGAALATMTDQGIPAVDAATKIKTAIISMAAPIGATKKAFASIGIGVDDLAKELASPRGLQGALEMLKSHMDAAGLTAIEQGQLIANAFGKRGGPAVMLLLASMDKLADKEKQITEGADKFGEAVAAMEEDTAFKADKVAAAMGAIAIQIGTALLPVVNDALDAISGMLSGDGIQQVFAAIGQAVSMAAGLIAGFVGALQGAWKILGDLGMQGPIIVTLILGIAAAFGAWAIGAAAAAVATLLALAPIILAFAAVALAVKAVQMAFDYFGIDIQKVVGGAFAVIGDIAKGLVLTFLDVAKSIADVMAFIPGPLQDAGKSMSATLDGMRKDVAKWGKDAGGTGFDAGHNVGKMMDDGIVSATPDIAQHGAEAGAAAVGGLADGASSMDPAVAEAMKTLGITATGALGDGVEEGTGAVLDVTKSLVERFGYTMHSVKEAAKVAGGAAMSEMAKSISDHRTEALTAMDDLVALMKSSLHPLKEAGKLAGDLASKALHKALKDNRPDVVAQANATVQLTADRLAELAIGGGKAGKKAMDALKKGMKDKDPTIRAASKHAMGVVEAGLKKTGGVTTAAHNLGAKAARALKEGFGNPQLMANIVLSNSGYMGGARAAGGPIDPGKVYRVGEHGPEWFVSASAGRIIPHSMGLSANAHLPQVPGRSGSGGSSAPAVTQVHNHLTVQGLVKARNPFEIVKQQQRLHDFGVLRWPQSQEVVA